MPGRLSPDPPDLRTVRVVVVGRDQALAGWHAPLHLQPRASARSRGPTVCRGHARPGAPSRVVPRTTNQGGG